MCLWNPWSNGGNHIFFCKYVGWSTAALLRYDILLCRWWFCRFCHIDIFKVILFCILYVFYSDFIFFHTVLDSIHSIILTPRYEHMQFSRWKFRSSLQRCSINKAVHKHFEIFTGKHLCLKTCNFIKKRLQHRSFPVKTAKLLRARVLKNICGWLFLLVFNKFWIGTERHIKRCKSSDDTAQ